MATNVMHIVFHITSYSIPLLLIGLAPSLIPAAVQGVPLALSCIFNLCISHFNPAPNGDQLFTFFHFVTWTFSGCWLAMLSYSSDISAVLAVVKTSAPLLIGIVILAFLIYLLLLGALFRYTVAHNNNDMGVFGIVNSGFYRVMFGCWEFVKGGHLGCQGCISGCQGCISGCQGCLSSCSEVRDGCEQEGRRASSPPPYAAIFVNDKTNSNHFLLDSVV